MDQHEETNSKSRALQVVVFIALFIFLAKLLGSLDNFLPAISMKCNDATIRAPMIYSVSHEVFVAVMFFITFLALLSMGLMDLNSSERSRTCEEGFVRFIRPPSIFLIGLFATWTSVDILSKYLGFLAPNFLAACQPFNVTGLCEEMSSHYVIVNCTTHSTEWIPASYAFPSFISTIEVYTMCFLVLYLAHRIKSRGNDTMLNYVARLLAFVCAWDTGCMKINYNEATISAVLVGCGIGILSAVMMVWVLKWLERDENNEQLPRIFNDPLVSRDAVSAPPPPYNSLFRHSNNQPLPVHFRIYRRFST